MALLDFCQIGPNRLEINRDNHFRGACRNIFRSQKCQATPFEDRLPHPDSHLLDATTLRREDLVLHLHRFHDKKTRARPHHVSRYRIHLQDRTLQRRHQNRACFRTSPSLCRREFLPPMFQNCERIL